MKYLFSIQRNLHGYTLFFVISVLSLLILAIDLSIPLGVAGGVPYVLIVLLAQWSNDRRHIFAPAVLGSVLTLVGYFASPEGGIHWMVLTNRGLALFAIWATALLCYGRRGIEGKLLEEEERRGFLNAAQQKEANAQGLLSGYTLLGLLLLLAGVILAIDLSLPLGVAGGVPYVLIVLLAQWSSDRRHILSAAVLGSLLTMVGYYASPEGGIHWMVLTNRGLALFAIWVTALLCYGRKGIEGKLLEEEERRELEIQMQRAQKLESLGIMAGGIAHDLNNLLMGILGNAEMAQIEESLSPKTRQFLEEIVVSAERAGDLACQMLAYSGRGRMAIQVLDPNEILREMRTLIEPAISKSINLKFDLEENIPPIECDGTQIRQIIVNLMTNAAEAIGDAAGTVTVSSGVETVDPATLSDSHLWENMTEGDYVFIAVKDTGPGIEENIRQKIFDPFFSTKFTGRGLGLSTVLGAVRGHGGAIQVESEPGQGALFKVFLPASNKRAEEPDRETHMPPAWKGEGTVLLVDDEEIVRKVTRRMLEELGFSVVAVSSGEEAVEMFRKRRQDIVCVILDMTMPGMNGEMTGRALRDIDPNVPIVLTSGYNEKEVMGRITSDYFSDVIQKPYKVGLLAAKLQQVLQDNEEITK